ncbi:hypothetical protein F511_38212 [Dorcoceras hygrometricum]|uniref:Uncharacterized protein n=1 Tax=Dorcoceras hygrometricum TaxID=472368 RepID=A0A2Z7DDC2_9LAMI|nr:hypothetical protein F511_38212 [Dorcoceras hygrometricum]
MLAGITRILENQSERPKKSHEEDVAERCCKQGPKEFAGTTDPLVAEEWNLSRTVGPLGLVLRTFMDRTRELRTVLGEIRVLGVTTLALLDSGATHSFISSAFMQRMGITSESLGMALAVTVPSGEELCEALCSQLIF